MKTPPLLHSEVLARTMRLGRMNGAGVLVIAGAGAVACAMLHDVYGAAIGLLIALGGAAEIHGAGMIGNGRIGGMRWLVGSQLYLIVVICAYCYIGFTHISLAELHSEITPQLKEALQPLEEQYGYSEDRLLVLLAVTRYGLFAFLTVLYQGAMMLVYARRSAKISAALQEE